MNRSIRILVVDDHPLFRQGLRQLLDLTPGFEVVGEAADGVQGLEQTVALRPDIVLLDFSMPGLDGMQVLARLREEASQSAAILLTAAIDRREMLEAVMLGARGVLIKTVDAEMLLRCVREVAGGGYWLEHEAINELVATLKGESQSEREAERAGDAHLTPRERQIVAAVVGGASNADISREFGLSGQTVKNHLGRIFNKLGVATRLELALYGLHNGLATMPSDDACGMRH
jgi:DNA-binding NarL/FixJ family response regulator